MTVQWLLESNLFDYTDALAAEIHRQGMNVQVIDLQTKEDEQSVLSCFEQNSCVIAHGSLQLGRLLHSANPWNPGFWGTFNHYRHTAYESQLKEYLLNKQAMIYPFGDYCAQYEKEIIAGKALPVFVKPDTCTKEFPGLVVTPENYEETLSWYKDDTDPALQMIAAPIHPIEQEWRIIIGDNRIITGCAYSANQGRQGLDSSVPDEVLRFVNDFMKTGYKPDHLYVVDVCSLKSGELRIIEPNTFSFSDWYTCDLGTIVREAAAIAEKYC